MRVRMSTGVINLPTVSIRRPGKSTRLHTTRKKAVVYIDRAKEPRPLNGLMPISNEATAVRGVAKSGPITMYTATASTVPACLPKGLVRSEEHTSELQSRENLV